VRNTIGFNRKLKARAALRGAAWSLPVLPGMAVVGIAYGLLAQRTGLGLRETLGMSLFVFAGASQFMALSMLSQGMEAAAIVAAAFAVNFRHVLMSASIAPRLASWKTWQRWALGGMLTDESFALFSLRLAQGRGQESLDPAEAIALNCAIYVAWAAFGAAGYRLGALIERPEAWGLDFALPAMFAGLLLPLCRSKAAATAALCGGTTAVVLNLLGWGSWGALIGALAGATAGLRVKERAAP
jgi:4-azaleucine resistance transporter AzlC